MTLPLIGTTLDAQSANIVVPATSTASGTATFVGPSGVQGSLITCTVSVPNAGVSAVFTATLGSNNGQGVIVGTWGGDSSGGRFQITVGQTLVVTAIGLAPSTLFTCTFATVTDVGPVQLVVPDPNTSALTALLQSAPTIITSGTTNLTGGVSASVPNIQLGANTYQSIIVSLQSPIATGTTVALLNQNSGAFFGFTGPVSETGLAVLGGGLTFILEWVNEPGDLMSLFILSLASETATPYTVYGVRSVMAIQTSQAVGNPIDVVEYGGFKYAQVTGIAEGATSGNILAAASTGQAFALKQWGIQNSAAVAAANQFASLQDANGPLDAINEVWAANNGFGTFARPLYGLLTVGPVTATNFIGNTATVWVRYDIVTLPTIV